MKAATTKNVRKPKPCNPSEVLFKDYLEAHRLRFVYEKASGAKQPDYRVSFDGGEVICEVKELCARGSRPKGAIFTDPYGGIRKAIHKKKTQLSEYKAFPCVLILYNFDDWEFDDWPPVVFGAMRGDLGVRIPCDVEKGVAIKSRMQNAFLANGRLQKSLNTRFSAIGVLKELNIPNPAFHVEATEREAALQKRLDRSLTIAESFAVGRSLLEEGMPNLLGRCVRVVVCENSFAKVPLPSIAFTGDFDEKHRFNANLGRIERVFVGKRVQEAERLRSGDPDPTHELQSFVQNIVEQFNPERVILFGSHAHGSAEPGSDVDLLVIFPGGGDASNRSLDIRRRLHVRFPLDLISHSTKEVERRLKLSDPFIREVIENGRTLYQREVEAALPA